MTPAKALKPGHVQASLTVASTAHSTALDKTSEATDALKNSVNGFGDGPDIPEPDYRDIVEVGSSWLLFTPGATVEIMGRIGVVELLEGLDVGFRYDFNVAKGDAKLQVFESSDGVFALAVQGGYAYHTGSVDIVSDYLKLAEWTRQDLDFLVSAGLSYKDNIHFWFAPRLMVSFVDVQQALPDEFVSRLPAEIRAAGPDELIRNETMYYYGATLGTMLGWRPFYFTLEVTIMSLAFEPEIYGEPADFDSFVIAPAGGFSLMW